MKKERKWIIIDLDTKKALYGANRKTLRFSEKEIAQEVGEQLFEKQDRFTILNIDDLGILQAE